MILNKKFFFFNALNILDKFLIFFLPVIPLIFFNDQLLYNKIEFIYSVSLFLYVFLDGGIKNYSLSFYRNSKNKITFLNENLKYMNTLCIYYLFLFTLVSFFIFYYYEIYFIYVFILFRILQLIYSNYYKIHFSLKNNQLFIFFLTLIISILSIIYIFSKFYFFTNFDIFDFFLIQILVVSILTLNNFLNKNYINFVKVIKIFKKSFTFSSPLILNALIFLVIMHFIKIYSYNYLSENEMSQISFILRMMLIIQIFHGGFTNYFYKNFFETKTKKFDLKIMINYLFVLAVISLMIFFSFPFICSRLNLNFNLDLIFILIFTYTVVWCIAAFLEQYLNKFYKNKYILFYSLISLLFYVFVIFFFNNFEILIRLCLAMVVSVSVYFLLISLKIISILNEK